MGEVMEHLFSDEFELVKNDHHNVTTNPLVWSVDFVLAIHIAGGDNAHPLKYLPLKLNNILLDSNDDLDDLEYEFLSKFQTTYVKPPDANDLANIVQKPSYSV